MILDWQLMLSLFTIAAAVLAAGFGILGLTTKYKDEDGRLTRYGRFAVCGFVLSAFLSISSQVIKDRIAADQAARSKKAADEARDREQQRYAKQIGQLIDANIKLQKLLTDTGGLQRDMGKSLSASEGLAARSSRILGSTLALAYQQRQSSDRMLFSIWQTASRVSGAGVTLSMRLGCESATSIAELRALFDGATASISVTGDDQFDRLAPHNAGAIDPVIPQFVQWPKAIQLRATHTAATVHAKANGSGGYLAETIQFGPFFTDTPMGDYALLERWRNAIVELSVRKPDLPRGQLRWAFSRVGDEQPAPGLAGDARLTDIYCSVGFYLSVNGLLLATPGGTLVYYRAGPADEHGELIARSILTRTNGGLIPGFPSR